MDLLLPGIAACATLAAFWIGRRLRAFPTASNFEGRRIPVAGLALAAGLLVACLRREAYVAGLAVVIFGLLGTVDDRYGDRSTSGFRGHIRAVMRGRVTTGFVKMAGGGLAALLCGYLLKDAGWHAGGVGWIAKAGVIALGANAVNLLDTRPMRAVLGFWCISALAAPLGDPFGIRLAGIAASLVWAPLDRLRLGMLGDAGSNALGAFWGVLFVSAAPAWAVGLTLVALATFHLYAEKRSLNADIGRVKWIRRLDEAVRGR